MYNIGSLTAQAQGFSLFNSSYVTMTYGYIASFTSFNNARAYFIGYASRFNGTTFTQNQGLIMSATSQNGTCLSLNVSMVLSNLTHQNPNPSLIFFPPQPYTFSLFLSSTNAS